MKGAYNLNNDFNNDYPIYNMDINDNDVSMNRFDMRRDYDYDRRRYYDYDRRRRDFDFDRRRYDRRRRDFDFDFDFPLWFFFWRFFF
ncbi:hypothetical protein SDC9_104847 [bioreactor metagenome]|jgi:hypothetical protein|uniref:Uncharacterized protein n=1 Tax=bioreactor metagenome TaxID=1076179 RepID=A0A645AZ11_9ZZZZ